MELLTSVKSYSRPVALETVHLNPKQVSFFRRVCSATKDDY